ncbi:ABC transporter substrate-binding protein [Conexibacter sp. CPCC 206217]|uniref:ABC transporter substrate-binding protein n=1 Tax=Conexibacter sp. CPCC 206217 TaxID=3064574 RepID=UPI00271B1CDD|nr:ABC transporter substrate-binding protein [Conexibacter sp. CPCC 206217]MDO8213594.1 ABC transporter substrate-binding protein [Conexibacter sp. CPCC 206217]
MQALIGRRLRVAASLALVGSALVFGACGSDDDSGSTAASTSAAGTTEATAPAGGKLTIGMNSPTYSTQMVTFVAKDKGFFRDAGIDDVEVITSDDYIPGLIGGSLNITQGDTDQLLLAALRSPKRIKLIANYRSKEFQKLAVAKGIDSAADLKGKTVTGGDRGGRNEAVVKQMLTSLGVDPRDVKLVPFGGGSDDRLQALLANKVQATNLFPRHDNALREGGGKFLYSRLVDVPQESIAATEDYIADNPELIDGYLTATQRARSYIADPANADEVIRIMRDNRFEITQDFIDTFPEEVEQISPDGGFSVRAMDDLITEEQRLDLLPADLNWREFFDLAPLWRVQRALGLPESPAAAEMQG